MASNKNLTQKILPIVNIVIILGVLIILGFYGYKIYRLVSSQPEVSFEKIELNQNTISQKLLNRKHFGTPVSASEPTGRTDPFAPR